MNQRSQLTVPPDTASLLSAAAQRQQENGSKAGLAHCLLDEISAAFEPTYIHVWETGVTAAPRLIWWRGVADGDPALAMKTPIGIVKRFAGASGTPEVGSLTKFVSSCEVGTGIRISLELALPDDAIGSQQLLEFVEVLADLHRRSLVSSLIQNAGRVNALHHILALLHSDLDSSRIASSLASDTVELLQCRRISVARRKSKTSWELIAATAVSQPDPRADASRQICAIIEDACKATFSKSEVPDASEDRRPQGNAIRDVQSEVGTHTVQPLSVSGHWKDAEWAAVFEWQTPIDSVQSEANFREISNHAALAFKNSNEFSKACALSMLRRLPQTIRSRRLLSAVGLTAVVAAGLMLLEMDLQIEASGKLVPSERVFVFAPEDGVITDIFVEDGKMVFKETPLCVLRNEDLEIQLESIEGEVASTHARLASLDALRGDRSLTQSGMFSVEQAELRERLSSLEAQSLILHERIARLEMSATMAGQIYGDRLQELLKGRPVQRGQYLFELANPGAGWEIDLRIPEVDVRHVIHGQAESQEPLSISITVETDPAKQIATSLSRLSASTEIDEYGRLSVMATAISVEASISNPRPGAGVIGRIYCGKRPAGYVIFRRIIESFQRRWWK